MFKEGQTVRIRICGGDNEQTSFAFTYNKNYTIDSLNEIAYHKWVNAGSNPSDSNYDFIKVKNDKGTIKNLYASEVEVIDDALNLPDWF